MKRELFLLVLSGAFCVLIATISSKMFLTISGAVEQHNNEQASVQFAFTGGDLQQNKSPECPEHPS